MAHRKTKLHWGRDAQSLRFATVSALALALAACGGGGGGGGSGGGGGGGTVVTGNPPSVSADPQALGSVSATVSLTATASDPDGDAITYRWQQNSGAAVSGTSGFDSATATFTTPGVVDTLSFTVTATAGGQSDSTVVRVVVVEDTATAVFVDGDFTGTPDGSIDAPLTDLLAALTDSPDDSDFYVKSLVSGDAYALWQTPGDREILGSGQSLYGGYAANWERDPVDNRTAINSVVRGLEFGLIEERTEVSGFELTVESPQESPSGSVTPYGILAGGLSSSDSAVFVVDNNTIVVGDAEPTGISNRSVSAYGIYATRLTEASITNNLINVGDGALGSDRSPRTIGEGTDGADGIDAREGNNASPGAGGSGAEGWNGGSGGEGGRSANEWGRGGIDGRGRDNPVVVDGGFGGRRGGSEGSSFGGNGGNGDDGLRGASGAGGVGSNISTGLLVGSARGVGGSKGWSGGGGGGGGGGKANGLGQNGGGGGGGGEGGEGGAGGFGANGGGASVGIYVLDVDAGRIANNDITTGNGGLGGLGGRGASGGKGGDGGEGAPGNFANAGEGDGGDGGKGGDGGDGGYGGSGGGGASYGVVIGPNDAPQIVDNVIQTGNGGNGGPARLTFDDVAAGRGGWTYGIFDLDLTDGVSPVVSGNTINVGTPGNDGAPATGVGEAGEERMP